jgi:hypothetical protein
MPAALGPNEDVRETVKDLADARPDSGSAGDDCGIAELAHEGPQGAGHHPLGEAAYGPQSRFPTLVWESMTSAPTIDIPETVVFRDDQRLRSISAAAADVWSASLAIYGSIRTPAVVSETRRVPA